jgi:hypothetical protein
MAEIVFALYRPKPGRAAELEAIVATHVAELRKLGLVSERAPIVARSRRDGTIIEAFEWASAAAIERAHRDPAVQAIWARFAACADYPSFGQLAEASEPFAGFEPLNLAPAAARPRRSASRKRRPAPKKRAPAKGRAVKRGRKRR